jgi:hypothetical protein
MDAMRSKKTRATNLIVMFSFAAAVFLCPQAMYANDWLTGAGSPTPQLGENSNLYLDLDSGRLFRKTLGTWVNVGLLRASALTRGPGWQTGSGSPTGEVGDEGDIYLDITTGRSFKKNSGTWLFLADLKGMQGPPGLKGDAGLPGPAGPAPATHCESLPGAKDIVVAPGTIVEVCTAKVLSAGRYVAIGRVEFEGGGEAGIGVGAQCRLFAATSEIDVSRQRVRIPTPGPAATADGTLTVLGQTDQLPAETQFRISCEHIGAPATKLSIRKVRLIAMQVTF